MSLLFSFLVVDKENNLLAEWMKDAIVIIKIYLVHLRSASVASGQPEYWINSISIFCLFVYQNVSKM